MKGQAQESRFRFNRRSFLSLLGLSAGCGLLGGGGFAKESVQDQAPPKTGRKGFYTRDFVDLPVPLASYPVLQNPDPKGMTVAWAVQMGEGDLATGWVEWGTTPDLGNTTRKDIFGLNELDEFFLSARLTGLCPNTKYFYRTATSVIHFNHAKSIIGEAPVYSEVYSFTTPGRRDGMSFALINDTHENQAVLEKAFARIREENPDYVVWDGDLLNEYNTPDQIVQSVFCPQYGSYFAEHPLLFVNGNHEERGIWARRKGSALTPWEHSSRFRELGRNFVFRCGPLAMVALDVGENWSDNRSEFAGLANFEPYRLRQCEWLEEALRSRKFATAPFKVALCHIPIVGGVVHRCVPGGDPDYIDATPHTLKMWNSLLSESNVQVALTAHIHGFKFTEPEENHSYAQIGGGSNVLEGATILFGRADQKKLVCRSEKLLDGSTLNLWECQSTRLAQAAEY